MSTRRSGASATRRSNALDGGANGVTAASISALRAGASVAAPPITPSGDRGTRVVLIGAPESGKTSAVECVFHPRALSELPEHDERARQLRPGNALRRKHRLRRNAAPGTSSVPPAAPPAPLGGGHAGGLGDPSRTALHLQQPAGMERPLDDTASAVGSVANSTRYVSLAVDVVDVAIGSTRILQGQVMELRDTDAQLLANDRLFAREVLAPETRAVVVFVDASTLYPDAVAVPKPPLGSVVDTVRAAKLAAEREQREKDRVEQQQRVELTKKAPQRQQREDDADGTLGSFAASSASEHEAHQAGDGAATVEEPPVRAPLPSSVSAADAALADAIQYIGADSIASHPARVWRGKQDVADATIDAELACAVRTVTQVVEATRSHVCPPAVRVVVALSKADVLIEHVRARQVALKESKRWGSILAEKAAAIEATVERARSDSTTIITAAGSVGANASPFLQAGQAATSLANTAVIVDESQVMRDAQRVLDRLQQVLQSRVEQVVGSGSAAALPPKSALRSEATVTGGSLGSGGDSSSNGALPSSSAQRSAIKGGTPAAAAGGGATTGRRGATCFVPEVTAISARLDDGDSVAELFNALLVPKPERLQRLESYMENMRRSTKIDAAVLIDAASLQVVASSGAFTPPHGHQLALQRELGESYNVEGDSEGTTAALMQAAAAAHAAAAADAPSSSIDAPLRTLVADRHEDQPSATQPHGSKGTAVHHQQRSSTAYRERLRLAGTASAAVYGAALPASAVELAPLLRTPLVLRTSVRLFDRLRRVSLESQPQHHQADLSQGAELQGDVTLDDGRVLLVRQMAAPALVLAATMPEKDFENQSLVDYNLCVLRRAVEDALGMSGPMASASGPVVPLPRGSLRGARTAASAHHGGGSVAGGAADDDGGLSGRNAPSVRFALG